ncbi:MAG TPA: hypothetical protein VEX86_08695 [Longimicrobium sp.]|nr:hypothetical protein [Longimicrobium sp.]
MIDRRILFAAVPVLALAAAGASYAQREATPPPYRLSLRAMLFYSDKGTFSRDLIARPAVLWNTPIGEGASGGASSATLVVADVRGEGGSYVPARKVELTVTENGRTTFQRAEETSVLNAAGHTHVGFWLYGTGCRRVRLSARIQGQQPSTPVTATIPFDCGE